VAPDLDSPGRGGGGGNFGTTVLDTAAYAQAKDSYLAKKEKEKEETNFGTTVLDTAAYEHAKDS